MVNLRDEYGDNLYRRSSTFKSPFYFNLVGGAFVDALIAWVMVVIFSPDWSYPLLKTFVVLQLLGILRYLTTYVMASVQYRAHFRKELIKEVRHYTSMFIPHVSWDDAGWYDTLLLEAAFAPGLDERMKVLAAISYGSVVGATRVNPMLDDWLYDVYAEVIDENREKYGQS